MATAVYANSIEKAALEKYLEYISRDGLSSKQNEILATCMIKKLSDKGKTDLANALVKRSAELAILADGHDLHDRRCFAKAIIETR